MIKLRGKTETQDPSNKIIFEPRAGFSRGRKAVKTLEFPLIYGHRCPHCSNIIQALFKAPSLIDLWPYEETVLLSQGEKNSGEIRKIFPDEKTKHGSSCFRMEFSPAEGGSVKLVLKNHIMRHRALSEKKCTGEGLWETGEKPCVKAGIFSLREDLLLKDFLLFSHMTVQEIPLYKTPKIKELIKEDDVHFKLALAVGVAPPVILVEKQALVYGFHYHSRPLMLKFKKSAK